MQDIEQIILGLDRDNLALDEIETTFVQTGDDRKTWRVWTNDLVWIRRLHAKGGRLVRWDAYGVAFDLDDNQIRVHQPISDAQRQKMAAHLAARTPDKSPEQATSTP